VSAFVTRKPVFLAGNCEKLCSIAELGDIDER
jgi:hypothetical protein